MQSSITFQKTQNYSTLKTNALSLGVGIAYIGNRFFNEISIEGERNKDYKIDQYVSVSHFDRQILKTSIGDIPNAILVEVNEEGISDAVQRIRKNPLTAGVIVILLTDSTDVNLQQQALAAKANDIYFKPFDVSLIFERISFLIKFKLLKPYDPAIYSAKNTEYKMPLLKRLFDISVSLVLLFLLIPIFLLVAILIRLESKGPILYKSKRAGSGYKIFDFYKFRSMVIDAEKKLSKLSETNNQYTTDAESTPTAFVKILNDPRITKVGNILRKTSIDELPQLFNVLKGDMSIVGNRPLPLYEAEQLTSDQFAMRFLGPAGITGLWQISKRGQAEMSEDERKELDNTYAKNGSFWMDLKIMLKTVPAMLQKEKV